MNRYMKIGIGVVAGLAAGAAIFKLVREKMASGEMSETHEGRPPYAEAAQTAVD